MYYQTLVKVVFKKNIPMYPNTLVPIQLNLIVYLCVCMCVCVFVCLVIFCVYR